VWILRGAGGKAFVAGTDIAQFQTFAGPDAGREYEGRMDAVLDRLERVRKPTIAQVQGAAVAGGFMVANMCDLVVASGDAFFADPVCRTLAASAVEVLCHPWVMGLRSAKEFLFTGRRMGAAEAHRLGMVNRVVPRAELEAATTALAEEIAAAPPFAIKLTKRSLNRAAEIQGFRSSIMAHFDTHQLAHVSEEFKQMRERGLASAIARGKAQTAT
jgi:enoyl-CoA hydratase